MMVNEELIQKYVDMPHPVEIIPPSEDDEDWFAHIPLLQGCMTQGISLDELWENILEAKRLWIESMLEANQRIPEPERVS